MSNILIIPFGVVIDVMASFCIEIKHATDFIVTLIHRKLYQLDLYENLTLEKL